VTGKSTLEDCHDPTDFLYLSISAGLLFILFLNWQPTIQNSDRIAQKSATGFANDMGEKAGFTSTI
jgi:hypothetical protein